jgi:hypothetical protein
MITFKEITQADIDKIRAAQQVCIADMYNVLGVPINERECPDDVMARGELIWELTRRVEAIE